jgi:hypothetical protein
MSVKYADRAFISINGTPLVDLQSATLRQNRNARVVPSMTRDGFNKGFVQGNRDIDVALTIAVQNQLSSPKLEEVDYENADVQINFQCGSDQYIATGVFLKDSEQAAGGIGDEVKKTFNFGALKLVDSVGNSSLFDLILPSL